MQSYLSEHKVLPLNSIVAINSISHLKQKGLDYYAGELCNGIGKLSRQLGSSTKVMPLAHFPLVGTQDEAVVIDLLDLETWMTHVSSGNHDRMTLSMTRKKLWTNILSSDMVAKDSLSHAPSRSRTLLLPVSLTSTGKKAFHTDGWDEGYPLELVWAETHDEEYHLRHLLAELNSRFGMNLNSDYYAIDCNVPEDQGEEGRGQTIIIGGSHPPL